MDAFTQLQSNLLPHPLHEAEGDDVQAPTSPCVQAIAFYLPQFHPIPENDLWWGRGFTEWTNVTRGLPRFDGHFQPRLPADLGFYDLRLPDVLTAQATMAKRYGIHGFCFHWYWFGGKRLLEAPLRTLLAHPEIDLPFFINWANENWTRRWDGHDKAILLAQNYGLEDDLALADAFLELVRDPRYMRIDGRPLLMLYTPGAMPNAATSIARWRQRFIEQGEQPPYVLMPHRSYAPDPRPYGIDAVVQYPPHNIDPPLISTNGRYRVYDTRFTGKLWAYEAVAARLAGVERPEYRLFRGLCPAWDNEARRPNAGTCFAGSTPQKYGSWLANVAQETFETCPPGERLVFINAWNEWAEGAYLEPDRHFGHAYLRETARALQAVGDPGRVEKFIAARHPAGRYDPPRASIIRRATFKARRGIRNLRAGAAEL